MAPVSSREAHASHDRLQGNMVNASITATPNFKKSLQVQNTSFQHTREAKTYENTGKTRHLILLTFLRYFVPLGKGIDTE
ncbi:MAG: hypothetical protein ACKVON_02610 [Beijerinckiaceae bacterium]